jgi:hypothetical protein
MLFCKSVTSRRNRVYIAFCESYRIFCTCDPLDSSGSWEISRAPILKKAYKFPQGTSETWKGIPWKFINTSLAQSCKPMSYACWIVKKSIAAKRHGHTKQLTSRYHGSFRPFLQFPSRLSKGSIPVTNRPYFIGQRVTQVVTTLSCQESRLRLFQ